MTRFVIDTNVLLTLNTDASVFPKEFWDTLFGADVDRILPAAVKAELLSIALQRQWGEKRHADLQENFRRMFLLRINDEIISIYAELDAYSQGKLKDKPLGISARNMGKNDLWIAATAVATNAVLATNDNDFDHLNGTYLQLLKP